MTPSWFHQTHSIVFRPKWFGLEEDVDGRDWVNPKFLAFRKRDPLFIAYHNPMQERLSFLSGKQNLACVLASFHLLSFSSCSTHFPIFWTFPTWHVAAWKWLLEKHPIARQAFFAIGSSSSKKACNWQSSTFLGRFSRFLSLRSKLSSLIRRNQSLHVVSDKALLP